MKNNISILFSLLILFISCSEKNDDLDSYNVKWDSPSHSSIESMPVGGHSIGCNVWVENGDILFYAQRSGSFTENNEYHKLGRFRLQLSPNPFYNSESFSQELKLKEGYVELKAEKDGHEAIVSLWVEAQHPIIHLDIESHTKINAKVSYENWRTETKFLDTKTNYGPAFGCFSWMCYPDSIFRHKDMVVQDKKGILFYHRNRNDKLLIDYSIQQQGLTNVKDKIVNTQINRTFGGYMSGEGFVTGNTAKGKYLDTDFKAWTIASEYAKKKHSVKVYTHINQSKTLEVWKDDLENLVLNANPDKVAKQKTREWWAEFWNKSWIKINPKNRSKDSTAWEIARNYQLFRYQLGCNYYGSYPTKFNGGNFTVDPMPVFAKGDPKKKPFTPCGTPDWRAWGGGSFTAQNQRLVYWPLLKSGDFDAMLPQFDFYKRSLPTAKARVKEYWGHKGACFTEQMEDFGLPIAAGWGWSEDNATHRKRPIETPDGEMCNGAIRYHYESQLEFSFMVLEYHRFTGNDISQYMDFIKESIYFYDEHYQMRHRKTNGKPLDKNGKLLLTPSTACESYKNAVNPIDAVAGLKACVNHIINLPEKYINPEERNYFKLLQKRLPDLSYDSVKGDKIILPAKSWSYYQNSECPQFYPLFPFNLFSLEDSEDIEIFRNTWKHGTFPKTLVWSWHQDGIFYARMGLTEKAKDYNIRKLKSSDQRFPTFWGPGHDWVPDHNWGGSGMIGLQEMLLQTNDDKIYLFPAWPKEWDVDFKLHAPNNTIIEGELINEKLEAINVTPKHREKDIINCLINKN